MANKLQGLSVSLPLTYDNEDGPYRLNKTLKQVVKQNFKNLILTSPGERVMLPTFGAGVRRLLFEPLTSETFSKVSQRISSQVTKFMSFLKIENISFITPDQDSSLSPNSVRLIINYNIGPINDSDTLIITQNID
jgi:phage baseplate assembly protein W|tara:strand:- start:417 stop:821 length:405 start_codon:yes stop_codon:yes gene_type:complete